MGRGIKPAEAAKELNCRPQLVRIKMQKHAQGQPDGWDLGEAIPPDKTDGGSQWTYYIYRAKLDRHLGKGVPIND